MKVESRTEPTVGAWEGLSRFLPQGVTLFATGLSGLLILLIGVPVLMVILMSLRTGFPGRERSIHAGKLFDGLPDAANLRNSR